MNKPLRMKTLKRVSVRKKGIMGMTKRREPTRLMAGALFAENLRFEINAPAIILVELDRTSLGPTRN